MLRTRVIPCLLLQDGGLVKTVRFKNPTYIGDPINSVRIYNELMVDELCFLDITASLEKREPNIAMLRNIARECFMPFAYGGGISTMDHAKALFDIGVEKLIINSAAIRNPALITQISDAYGAQAVIAALDVTKNIWGTPCVATHHDTVKTKLSPLDAATQMQEAGAGEILLNAVQHDGMMQGFDTALIHEVAHSVSIPVIALGGAGELGDILKAKQAGAAAIGLGSMAVYQNRNKGILIQFPKQKTLLELFEEA